jgi:hypothetical protein
MKVTVTIKLDIDEGSWMANFGTNPKEVRQDIKTFVFGSIQEQLELSGINGQVVASF